MASDQVAFRLPAESFSHSGRGKPRRTNRFTVLPVCVEFQRLLKQKNAESIIPGVSSRELLNIVIALYDVCLPEIGLEDLRANVCARGAKTVILVRDEQEVLEEYQKKVPYDGEKAHTDSAAEPQSSEEEEEENDRPGMFSFVFSDSESSDDDEDDDSETESDREENERFNSNLKEFLARVKERGQQRRHLQEVGSTVSSHVIGIETRIVAAMTYQLSTLNSKEKVIQLSLLSTRRRYRGFGVGQYIVKLLKDYAIVGLYDAIVTHADSGAVQFFSRCGFSDDVLLNSKFREFGDDWTNTTMMSYFPPFTKGASPPRDEHDIELEMELWKMKSLAAYQTQTVFMTKVIHEIRALRTQLKSQKDQIKSLTSDLEKTKNEKYKLEKRFLQYRLDTTLQLLQSTNLNTEELLSDDQEEFTTRLQSVHKEEEDSKHQQILCAGDQEDREKTVLKIKMEFIEKMHQCPGMEGSQVEVSHLVQASISTDVKNSIDHHMSSLGEPSMRTRLYYCGGLGQPERLTRILSSGFSTDDIHAGPYGKGLYFSSSVSTACKCSPPCQVLVADVHVGNTETVHHKDKDRVCASKGFDSILVPGQFYETASTQQTDVTQEFIVFSHLQAFPICLLTYSIGSKSANEEQHHISLLSKPQAPCAGD